MVQFAKGIARCVEKKRMWWTLGRQRKDLDGEVGKGEIMTSKSEIEILCVFCGKKRTVEIWEDDGMDFYGHARGRQETSINDRGCDCKLGKIEQEKISIKPMCCNCLYKKSSYCTNKKELKQVSDLFDVGDKLIIKDLSKKCEFYELDTKIFYKVLER